MSIQALLIIFVPQVVLFAIVYFFKYKKFEKEKVLTKKNFIVDSVIVLLAITITNILVNIVLSFVDIPRTLQTFKELIPIVIWLIVWYSIFKNLIIRHWIEKEKARKIADQTIVYYVVILILIYFLVIWLSLNRTSSIWNQFSYQSQSRDIQRINDINNIKYWIELYFQDHSEYPKDLIEIQKYIFKIPTDPKDWKEINWCIFWYSYKKKKIDKNNDWYILSTCFETNDYTERKAVFDWWNDPKRYEVGVF